MSSALSDPLPTGEPAGHPDGRDGRSQAVVQHDDAGRAYVRSSTLKSLIQQGTNLNRLIGSTRTIMGELDLDPLLGLIMVTVTEVMDADRSTLFLVDPETNELWSRVAQGSSEIRIPMGAGISGFVAQTGQTLNIPDAYADSRFNPENDTRTGYRTRSILCMPLFDQNMVIMGSIQVLNKLDGSAFSKRDEELLGAFASLAGISLVNARAFEEIRRARDFLEERVIERTRDLEESRAKSDKLLRNILPDSVAEELKEKGTVTPVHIPSASVLFTDFVGFTTLAEHMSPQDLIKELDGCFSQFDDICSRNGLEKLKTIGDAFMCAGGLPVQNRTHPIDTCLAAFEFSHFMAGMREIKEQMGLPSWQLRIGVHSGAVTTGVIGKNKFAYDIWGDTVNTASRMESAGAAGRVNISGATHALVQDFFECEYRGKVAAKNKGELDMYFLDRIRPELSIDGAGRVPNDEFRARRARLESGAGS